MINGGIPQTQESAAELHTTTHRSDHEHHQTPSGSNAMALAATLHCLSGCAIGEIAGLVIGTALGVNNATTIVISIALAFFFGYLLSTLPVLKSGLPLRTALTLVLAADTLSIVTMEVVDNAVMAVVPGAMNAGLVNVVFWLSLALSLVIAFGAAFPVNVALLKRGRGHALMHDAHNADDTARVRRFIPAIRTASLVGVLVAFMFGGFVVALADELS